SRAQGAERHERRARQSRTRPLGARARTKRVRERGAAEGTRGFAHAGVTRARRAGAKMGVGHGGEASASSIVAAVGAGVQTRISNVSSAVRSRVAEVD